MKTEFPSADWSDYELIDCGNYEKLERFGPYCLARPEPKALWDKALSEAEWNRMIHTRFTPGAGFGKAGKEDSGTWSRTRRRMEEQWPVRYSVGGPSFNLRLGLTSFKHVGVFPEQAPNWEFIYSNTRRIVSSARENSPARARAKAAAASREPDLCSTSTSQREAVRLPPSRIP